ncbi:hypothetical protein [Pseudoxanthomonas sacheonensis]|uniref:hypothetical protein n=1 Tax=Pseudoxanthomonas sacheonensis TaxID=443615 RepID=UPI0013D503AA|nr:hypothetical protein [Pseudoxanthomonas sacheonensis]KAF1712832.1 hypothetical protein CSC73_00635 [Pseudoxanthomonas sacheonensis]
MTLVETARLSQLGYPTTYLGFTSGDVLNPCADRRREFFHFSQRSTAHATQIIVRAWKSNPRWPRLTLVQRPDFASAPIKAANINHRLAWLEDAATAELQNLHLFHLCPSNTRGFDPRVMEAMSVGAIALTNQADLVNEWDAQDCAILMSSPHQEPNNQPGIDEIDECDMEHAVEKAMDLSDPEITRMSEDARASFRLHDEAFRMRLRQVMLEISAL